MTFSKVLEKVKNGAKAAREGWNGKGQYIELAKCVSYVNSEGKVITSHHESMGNNAIAFVGTSGGKSDGYV